MLFRGTSVVQGYQCCSGVPVCSEVLMLFRGTSVVQRYYAVLFRGTSVIQGTPTRLCRVTCIMHAVCKFGQLTIITDLLNFPILSPPHIMYAHAYTGWANKSENIW